VRAGKAATPARLVAKLVPRRRRAKNPLTPVEQRDARTMAADALRTSRAARTHGSLENARYYRGWAYGMKTAVSTFGARRRPNPSLVDAIRPGDLVTITNRFGQPRRGRAVMRSDPRYGPGWVLNMGGAHGTPGLANAANIVKVQPSKVRHGGGSVPPPPRGNPRRTRKSFGECRPCGHPWETPRRHASTLQCPRCARSARAEHQAEDAAAARARARGNPWTGLRPGAPPAQLRATVVRTTARGGGYTIVLAPRPSWAVGTAGVGWYKRKRDAEARAQVLREMYRKNPRDNPRRTPGRRRHAAPRPHGGTTRLEQARVRLTPRGPHLVLSWPVGAFPTKPAAAKAAGRELRRALGPTRLRAIVAGTLTCTRGDFRREGTGAHGRWQFALQQRRG
jgi:hypothetical protein